MVTDNFDGSYRKIYKCLLFKMEKQLKMKNMRRIRYFDCKIPRNEICRLLTTNYMRIKPINMERMQIGKSEANCRRKDKQEIPRKTNL